MKWSTEHDKQLTNMFNSGISKEEMSKKSSETLGKYRSSNAISKRLILLGLRKFITWLPEHENNLLDMYINGKPINYMAEMSSNKLGGQRTISSIRHKFGGYSECYKPVAYAQIAEVLHNV